MNKHAAIAASIFLLLAGVAAIFLVRHEGSPAAPIRQEAVPGQPLSRKKAVEDRVAAEAAIVRQRPRDPAENPELVALYGESRTKLSKSVAGNVIGLLEDAIAMGEMAGSGKLGDALGGARAGLRASLGPAYDELNLTDQQQAQASGFLADFRKGELELGKTSTGNLKQDPTALMQLMLASDALSRGRITAEEYQSLQANSGESLKNVINPLDRKNLSGGQPLGDPTFVTSLQATLDPAQAKVLQAALAERSANAPDPNAGSITNLPPMELEKLDQAITSGKAITGGLRQLMEGIGSLQQLAPPPAQPPIEPQP